jgi:hypothetical protein
LVAACDNSPPGFVAGGVSYTDGTRLVARAYSFPGAEPLFVGVYDKEEKMACTFRTAGDGKLRCMPTYVDPALDATPEHWVEGTEQPGDESTPRLRSHHVTSADGGRFPNRVSGELYDAQASWGCSPVVRDKDKPAEARCLPRYAGGTGFYFANPSCTEALAISYGPAPSVTVMADGAVHAAGPAFTTAPFVKVGTECTLLEQPMDGLIRVGAPLREDAVTNVEIAARGTGRLSVRKLETGGQPLATLLFSEESAPRTGLTAPYHDNTLGIDCYPHGILSDDGTGVRCLPADSEIIPEGSLPNAYSDPACTKMVINTTRKSLVATFRAYVTRVLRLGDYSETAYENTGDGCRENRRLTGRVVLDEVPMTTYAELEPTMGLRPTY